MSDVQRKGLAGGRGPWDRRRHARGSWRDTRLTVAIVLASLLVSIVAWRGRAALAPRRAAAIRDSSAIVAARAVGSRLALPMVSWEGDTLAAHATGGRAAILAIGDRDCAPCDRMVRALLRYFADHPSARSQAELWLVSARGTWASLAEEVPMLFYRSLRAPSGAALATRFGTRSIPLLVVVDTLGLVRSVRVGYAPGSSFPVLDSILRSRVWSGGGSSP